jgi:hypothetical protein
MRIADRNAHVAALTFALCSCDHVTPSAPPTHRAPSTVSSATANAPALDADGVMQILAQKEGFEFRLGSQDPNHAEGLSIEKDIAAIKGIEGAWSYYSIATYPLDYASGGAGKTARLHLHVPNSVQAFTWSTQHGFLSTPTDLRNQEVTVFVRGHEFFDPKRAGVTIKIRGGEHSTKQPSAASCTMMTFQATATGAVARFGKELDHPIYDYVKLQPTFDAALEDNRWYGLKLVSFARPSNDNQVVNRLYVDVDPIDGAGHPKNHWQLLAQYIDEQGKTTGHYDRVVNWGGYQTTVRVDGMNRIDFALLSAHEIVPPNE